jgi:SAM-dependent methyltransferase
MTMRDSGDKATRTHNQEPHQAREMAESFGSDPERYDRARPRYPDAMVRRVVAASPGPRFLDVGCGTGIASRQFHAAGCEVLGVEPDARMAEFARQRGLGVDVATFESWDPAGRAFDAVIAAQAWHWIDPLAGAAKAAQVLRPDGRLAVFWNVFRAGPEIAEAFAAVYRRVVPDWPLNPWTSPGLDAYAPIFQRTADGIRTTRAFTEPEQWRFDWEQSYTRDGWLEQMATGGDASQFPPTKLEALLAGAGVAIDAWGGRFTMQYATVVLTARINSEAAGPSVHVGEQENQLEHLAYFEALYEAFNHRDSDRVLAMMSDEVDWPNAWKGGRLVGREAVRDYWTAQWAEIDPHVEPLSVTERADGALAVTVRQVVRTPDGELLGDGEVVHVYRLGDGLIRRMDVEPPQQL